MALQTHALLAASQKALINTNIHAPQHEESAADINRKEGSKQLLTSICYGMVSSQLDKRCHTFAIITRNVSQMEWSHSRQAPVCSHDRCFRHTSKSNNDTLSSTLISATALARTQRKSTAVGRRDPRETSSGCKERILRRHDNTSGVFVLNHGSTMGHGSGFTWAVNQRHAFATAPRVGKTS